MTAETKAKLSASRKGWKPSAETRAKLAAAMTGRPLTPETIAKIVAANTGKRRSRFSPEEWAAHKVERARLWALAHPEKARQNGRKSAMNRRARILAAFVESVDPLIVFERAAGVCGICQTRIAIGDPWEVDHIIPLAKGGAHSYVNAQPAHATCNRKKSTRLPESSRSTPAAGSMGHPAAPSIP